MLELNQKNWYHLVTQSGVLFWQAWQQGWEIHTPGSEEEDVHSVNGLMKLRAIVYIHQSFPYPYDGHGIRHTSLSIPARVSKIYPDHKPSSIGISVVIANHIKGSFWWQKVLWTPP